MSIVLYNAAYSTCSQKVRICLAEKGICYEERQIDLGKNEHLTTEYLALNPNGVVPTLVHNDNVITESSVIVEYLDEVFPDPPLSPGEPVLRAKMRAWMRFLDEVPTAAVRIPSFNRVLRARFDGLDHETFLKTHAELRPIRKHFYQHMGPRGFRRQDVEASLEQLQQTAERMEAALRTGLWLVGEMFTLADIILAPLIDRMDDLGLNYLWKDRPQVAAWFDRMRARPSFERSFYPGSRLSSLYQFRDLFIDEPESKRVASEFSK